MTRDRRRHDLARMKAKARRFKQETGIRFHDGTDLRLAEKMANHLADCSCYMCGNPRRYWGEVTIQERRAPQCGDWRE